MPLFQPSRILGLSLVVALSLSSSAPARDAESTNAEPRVAESPVVGQESLRSNLQIQEQLHDALLAIEKNRQEAEAAAARNAELMEARLGLLEKTLAAARQDELQNMEHSDRMMLIAAGSFAAVGFLVLTAAAFLQWSGANRLAALAAAMPASNGLALENGEAQMTASRALEQANARFLSIIERLEHRIQSLEIAAPESHDLPEVSSENGTNGTQENGTHELSESPDTSSTDPAEAIKLLLAKGQTLLRLDQPEGALECFNEILAMDSANADALVKKGAALERLQRLDEAIECYDLAIARDNSLTMAYLYKGGVFNRMARYSEALACYEQALKTQQKGKAEGAAMG